MLWTLAQLDTEEALAKGYSYLALIALIALFTILFFLVMFMLRRWKRRQLKAIEHDKAQRRAGQTGERVDAWQASSDRYIDHDKLEPEDDLFERRNNPHDNEEDEPPQSPDEDNPDPFGLFRDAPYQDSDEDDDDDDSFDEHDEDDDWDEDEETKR